jgi:hypothetical protein
VKAPAAALEFPPHVLREYALIADGERGALIGPRGDIVWMCVPRWHSGGVFASLIGGAGVYAVTPAQRFVWGGYYEPGTLIWRSRWVTAHGIVECREALAFPGDPHTAVLLRRITAREQPASVHVVLDPRAGFGAHPLRAPRQEEPGHWTARAGGLYLRWHGDTGTARVDRGRRGPRLVMDLQVPQGGQRDLVLELSGQPLRQPPGEAGRLWRATRQAWEEAVPPLEGVIATRDARHAYAVMRGLTAGTGGMVAAATTSLPERAERGRNYDYRYVWVRDQCFAGQAAAAAGAWPLLDAAVRFTCQRLHAEGPRLAPACTVDGGPIPSEHRLGLPGYPGGSDLAGNRVGRQFQLDALGEVLLLLAAAARHGRLDPDGWEAAGIAVRAIAGRWQEPDAGIWELDSQAWTHSRLTCVAGLRAMAGAARSPRLAASWSALADAILAGTAARATHRSGRWQRSETDPGLDGALLLPPVRGALAAADPRTVRTLRAFSAELTRDGYAYRFRHGRQPLGEAEGAFLLCGFLLALASHQQGDEVAAVRWFERTRAACGPPGLFSEEYDVAQRQLRGNLPQAFVHALLLQAAATLARPASG